MEPIRYLPLGDRAVTVELGQRFSEEINRRVRGLAAAIKKMDIPGVREVVTAYRSLTVYYDPLVIGYQPLTAKLRDAEKGVGDGRDGGGRLVEIPVAYGGQRGPDLEFVARYNGLTPREVVKIHTAGEYLVYMVGFTPGFPYLGGMSARIRAPRLEVPRPQVPAGSVGIAGEQTGVYPLATPGGWRIIGQTPLSLFDPLRNEPSLLKAGDRVRFVEVAWPDED